MDGEYGGLGLALEQNRWPGRPESYEMAHEVFQRAAHLDVAVLVRKTGLSAAIYTQTTDVENEVNGILSYDRRVVKMPITAVAERNRAVIATGTPTRN